MIARVILFTLFAAYSAFGQLQWQLFQVDAAGNETPICNSQQTCNGIEMGSTATGTALTETFHLQNTGSTQADVDTLSVTGTGFQLVLLNSPSIPVTLLPGAALYFQIVFSSNTAGDASGSLTINSGGPYPLYASATAGGGPQPNPSVTPTAPGNPVVVVSGATVPPGGAIDLGTVQRGSSTSLTLLLEAPSDASAIVNSVSVTGNGFIGSGSFTLPATIAAGNSLSYTVTFTPLQDGALQGTLTLNLETFVLTGTGVEPPPPEPEIAINGTVVANGGAITLANGQQPQLAVQFAAPSSAIATGTATIELVGKEDLGVQFISPANSQSPTSLPFSVAQGDSLAHFSNQQYATFQTGTTAGNILVTVSIGQYTETATIVLPPAAIAIDPYDPGNAASATLSSGQIQLELAAFDNTRTASMAVFTFYDDSQNVLAGPFTMDLSQDFETYFASATAGGVFELNAAFPVSGDVSRIASMDVSLTNSQNTSTTNVTILE